jgi:hypothetical protein
VLARCHTSAKDHQRRFVSLPVISGSALSPDIS